MHALYTDLFGRYNFRSLTIHYCHKHAVFRKRTLGADANQPHRMKYKRLSH